MLRQRFIPLTVIVRKNHFANSFIQESPQHHNSYLSDPFLRRNLKRILPDEVFQIVNEDLVRFGHRCSTDIWDLGKKHHYLFLQFSSKKCLLGQKCEENPPYLKSASAWGNNQQVLVTSEAWKSQKAVSANEGLVAIAYEKKYHQFSRVYQAAK